MSRFLRDRLSGNAFERGSSPSGLNRRKQQRVIAKDMFFVEFMSPDAEVRYKGFGCDLSSGGAKFISTVALQTNAVVTMGVYFFTPGSTHKHVTVNARIVRCSKNARGAYEIGCAFEAEPRNLSMIKDFVDQLLREEKRLPPPAGKRLSDRVQAEDLFFIEICQGQKQMIEKGFGCDLSSGGVRFSAVFPLTRNALVDVILHFSPAFQGPSKIKVPAKVIQSELPHDTYYYQIRCQFLEEKNKTIQDFLIWLDTINR